MVCIPMLVRRPQASALMFERGTRRVAPREASRKLLATRADLMGQRRDVKVA
jgi:hypothetical protein